mgnify:CR=1 FL=1
MAEIIVLSPVTSNGINPVLDNKGQIIYKETILPLAAKAIIEKQNEKRPDHLKKKISLVEDKKVVKDEKSK